MAEGFDDITNLPNWFMRNNSEPLGVTDWFQGNPDVFESQSGAPESYIGANFNNTTDVGTISNWLLTPTVPLENGTQMIFWTRTVANSNYPDRLQVRASTNGDSTDVGMTSTSVGDFTTLLLDINPDYTLGGYPEDWAQFTVTISGLPSSTTGRFGLPLLRRAGRTAWCQLQLHRHRHRLCHRSGAATTATTTASAASAATAATAASASASASASATATATTATTTAAATATTATAATSAGSALPRATGDRTDPPRGQGTDPQGALLRRSCPPCPLEASRTRDRPEPAAGRVQAPRLPGQAGRRPALKTKKQR